MKGQRSTQARIAGRLSGAIIARHYLDLQRLRDEVRKAETKLRTWTRDPLIKEPTPFNVPERSSSR
jgi:hypothetical protein